MSPYTTRQKLANKPTRDKDKDKKNLSTSTPPQPVWYDLSSVIVHKGKLDSGHYVSYSREGNDWFLFDDSKVVLATEAEVLEANAYLLFYVVENIEAGVPVAAKTPMKTPSKLARVDTESQ